MRKERNKLRFTFNSQYGVKFLQFYLKNKKQWRTDNTERCLIIKYLRLVHQFHGEIEIHKSIS